MKKLIALLMVFVMAFGLVACTPSENGGGIFGGGGDDGELPTLNVYPYTALSAGVDTGYRSEIYKQNGFQVNIWAWSAEKTNSILTSGNLPDIMYVDVGDNLDTLIQTKKIINLEDYLDRLPNLNDNPQMQNSLDYLRDAASNGTGSVYGLPVGIGTYYSGVFTRSIEYYADKVIGNTGYDENLWEAMKAMVVYGDYARAYFA